MPFINKSALSGIHKYRKKTKSEIIPKCFSLRRQNLAFATYNAPPKTKMKCLRSDHSDFVAFLFGHILLANFPYFIGQHPISRHVRAL